MAEIKKQENDRISKALGFIPHFLTIATIIVGIFQYNKNTEKEIRKEFFYKQVSSYEKLTEKATNIIYNQSILKDSLTRLLNDFRTYRHGEYSLYTTDSVEKYASTFEYYYERYLKKDLITKRDLEVISYKLTNQCRQSMNQTLNVNLDIISFRKSLK